MINILYMFRDELMKELNASGSNKGNKKIFACIIIFYKIN